VSPPAMLDFADDAALARLVIAATRIPRRARSRWLCVTRQRSAAGGDSPRTALQLAAAGPAGPRPRLVSAQAERVMPIPARAGSRA